MGGGGRIPAPASPEVMKSGACPCTAKGVLQRLQDVGQQLLWVERRVEKMLAARTCPAHGTVRR